MFVMIRNNFTNIIKICENVLDTFVVLQIDNSASILNKNVYIICAYLPSIKSSFYRYYDCDIFHELQNLLEKYGEKGKIVVTGDII